MNLKLEKNQKSHPKRQFVEMLKTGDKVLDIGCWNYSFKRYCEEAGATDLEHFGVDRENPGEPVPKDYQFAKVELNKDRLPFDNETFDAVMASHVIEHVNDQLGLMSEIFRTLKVNGIAYVECPSVRSMMFPSMPFKFEEFRSINYFDDPTHVGRPHTPQSLYRLFRMHDGEVLKCDYIVRKEIRWKFPYLITKAWFRRDAAMLEDVMWKTFGFAVFGIVKKLGNEEGRYVLSQ